MQKPTILSLSIIFTLVGIAGVVEASHEIGDDDSVPSTTIPSADASATPRVAASPTSSPGETSASNPKSTQVSASPSATGQTYKDGTYSAVGSYSTPGGTERLGVTLTFKSDTVTAVSVDTLARDHDSRSYQEEFASVISGRVVGKKISSLNLGKVASSSLTTRGFMSALSAIKSQAS